MKSIMEEASSIAKAVEKAWQRAGKPQEFTVKVYEEPQKNFLGLTTKPAKVGLFFEPSSIKTAENKDKRFDSRSPRPAPQRSLKDDIAREFQKTNVRQEKPQQKRFNSPQDKPVLNKTFEKPATSFERPSDKTRPERNDSQAPRDTTFTSPWSDELTQTAKDWIKQSLQVIDNDQNFNAEVDRYALRVTFIKSITQNGEKEKMLFRSWAYLIMQALRQKYKRPLKGLKIILMSNA
jgi:predicted RNA-binding protein Jag